MPFVATYRRARAGDHGGEKVVPHVLVGNGCTLVEWPPVVFLPDLSIQEVPPTLGAIAVLVELSALVRMPWGEDAHCTRIIWRHAIDSRIGELAGASTRMRDRLVVVSRTSDDPRVGVRDPRCSECRRCTDQASVWEVLGEGSDISDC